ncbi:hypothetical protein [Paracoccus homiensis]|uniref:hypothetical protein n=1 Tax=Paracoccus homiensis TaxID=364199 RepID=UPI00398C9787
MHPETETTRQTAHTNDAALAAFVAKKAEIDAMLTRLQVFSDDLFGVDPERVNWADVGSLEYQASLLKQIGDFAFGRANASPDARLRTDGPAPRQAGLVSVGADRNLRR